MINRTDLLGAAAAGIFGMARSTMMMSDTVPAFAGKRGARHVPIRQIRAGVLDVGYYELGAIDWRPVFLLHGFPYSIDSYNEVAPILAARGCRVIVPYLRGHGSSRFIDADTPRSGEQAALGADLIALMDALRSRTTTTMRTSLRSRTPC